MRAFILSDINDIGRALLTIKSLLCHSFTKVTLPIFSTL